MGDEKKVNIMTICTIGFTSRKKVKSTAHMRPILRLSMAQGMIEKGKI
jgi:hypothetical protein